MNQDALGFIFGGNDFYKKVPVNYAIFLEKPETGAAVHEGHFYLINDLLFGSLVFAGIFDKFLDEWDDLVGPSMDTLKHEHGGKI